MELDISVIDDGIWLQILNSFVFVRVSFSVPRCEINSAHQGAGWGGFPSLYGNVWTNMGNSCYSGHTVR